MTTGGRIALALLFCLMALLPTTALADGKPMSCPMVKIEAERLPDMNVPRSGHSLLLVN